MSCLPTEHVRPCASQTLTLTLCLSIPFQTVYRLFTIYSITQFSFSTFRFYPSTFLSAPLLTPPTHNFLPLSSQHSLTLHFVHPHSIRTLPFITLRQIPPSLSPNIHPLPYADMPKLHQHYSYPAHNHSRTPLSSK